MKLDSKYFDMIRLSRPLPGARAETTSASGPRCQWRGCERAGEHRAPLGRGHDGEFYLFCSDHIRQYNQSYDYFSGMSSAEVEDFQKSSNYGHRPTWKWGVNAWSDGINLGASATEQASFVARRMANAARFAAWRAEKASGETAAAAGRRLKPLELKALERLGLSGSATANEIKARYKELVKRHHPDANGGDRASEDRLREIIQAYNYLKQSGLA